MAGRIHGFEITSTLEYFSDDLLDALIDWCGKNGYEYAWIVHDKDTKFNEETNQEELKKVHRHFVVKTGSSAWSFVTLAARFSDYGLKPENIQRFRKGWNNTLSYLVHRTDNSDGKHLYELSEVHANFDYSKQIEIIESQIEEKRGILDDLSEKIESGECRRYNINEYITSRDYSRHRLQIESLFKYHDIKMRNIQKERQMEVYWIYGESNIGKSTLARYLCKSNGWSFCESSSSNDPLQDYNDEDVLILDDFRPNHWTKTDVLKMLDNRTSSSVKSRYYNKQTSYLKAIIITTIQDPSHFWLSNGWENSGNEPFVQLQRRIRHLVEMVKDKEDGYTYYYVKSFDDNCTMIGFEKYNYTKQFDRERKKEEKEKKPSAFSALGYQEKIENSSNDIILNSVANQVDVSDIPPF